MSANLGDKFSVQDCSKDIEDNFSKQDFCSQDETFQASQPVTKFTLSEKHGLTAPLISQINVVAYDNLKANQYFAKFQGVMGHQVYVKQLPSVCGSLPVTEKQPLPFIKDGSSDFPTKIFNVKEQARMLQREMLKQGSGRYGPSQHEFYGCEFEDLMNMHLNHSQMSKNSPLTLNGSKSQLKQLLQKHGVTNHLDFSLSCKAIKKYHFILSAIGSKFSLTALEPIVINGKQLEAYS